MDIHSVIIKPIITERSMQNAEKGKFTFEVLKSANKDVIKVAVEKIFDVNVISVATSIVKGRSHRTGNKRIEIKQSPWKKATVGLKSGQKIGLFDVGENK
ncbi:MAG TPA: 50S ribosomal protein L23 [Candidatus Saccharimonadales bacterium]|nr:50S ribosomal protein L23 [Candidatus Saccharimonadales bacterium]